MASFTIKITAKKLQIGVWTSSIRNLKFLANFQSYLEDTHASNNSTPCLLELISQISWPFSSLFSHNKSANSTFSHGLSAKRTWRLILTKHI
jgi:hypothetical protein